MIQVTNLSKSFGAVLAVKDVSFTAPNGRITGLNRSEGTNLKLVWNQSIYAVDSWVILAGAENKDAGQDFIAFANAPENLRGRKWCGVVVYPGHLQRLGAVRGDDGDS